MTEKKILEIKKKISCKKKSPLNSLFFNRNGTPILKLYSKKDILNDLGIFEEMNSLEQEGIIRLLSVSLAMIRKRAKENMQPFIDYEITTTKNNSIALHGFTDDIDEIQANVEKYKEYAKQRYIIAKQTEKAGKTSIALLK